MTSLYLLKKIIPETITTTIAATIAATIIATVFAIGVLSMDSYVAASDVANTNQSNVSGDPTVIVAFGDSLTSGYGLALDDSFPVLLEKKLKKLGYNVSVINAGVAGDTSGDGLARIKWSVPATADAVIVELGANDALRAIDPNVTSKNLTAIMTKLTEAGHKILLTGMLAPLNYDEEYRQRFRDIYLDLDDKFDVVFYPFFLDKVASVPALNQSDGIHPNVAGVNKIVDNIIPYVEKLLARLDS